MSENKSKKTQTVDHEALLKELPAPANKIQIANATLITVEEQIGLKFFIMDRVFDKNFLTLPTMGTVLVGMLYFGKDAVTLCAKKYLVFLPDISMQVRKKSKNKYLKSFIELQRIQKTVIQPF